MSQRFSKYQAATFIAIFFHCIGFIGILFFDKQYFSNLTVYNLLLSMILLVWTQEKKNFSFYLFMSVSMVAGLLAEITGVNTSILFGEYTYGTNLGYKINNVPLIIAVNWFIIIYCSGIVITILLQKLIDSVVVDIDSTPLSLKAMSVIVDGATLAVFFDWVMEPVAIRLNFWQWKTGQIPFYNYVSWFVISILLLSVFHFSKFNKQNKFAVNLLLIQLMFFLLLRTFLN